MLQINFENGTIWTAADVRHLPGQVSQPEAAAMPTLLLHGAVHGWAGGLRSETGQWGKPIYLTSVTNSTTDRLTQFLDSKDHYVRLKKFPTTKTNYERSFCSSELSWLNVIRQSLRLGAIRQLIDGCKLSDLSCYNDCFHSVC